MAYEVEPSPFELSDAQVAMVAEASAALPQRARQVFLQSLAAELERRHQISDVELEQAIARSLK